MRRFDNLTVLAVIAVATTFGAGAADAARRLTLVADGTAAAAVATQLTAALQTHDIEVEPAAGSHAAALALSVQRTGYRLEAELIAAAGGRQLAEESVAGAPENVFDLIDELGRKLTRRLAGLELPQGTVAVLGFANRADAGSEPFVGGLPQMLLTSLRQHPELTLVEPQQIEAGRAALAAGDAAALGRWVGADVAVRGTFTDELLCEVVLTGGGGRELARLTRRGTRAELARLTAELAAEVAEAVERQRRATRTVAVLPFLNHGEAEYADFVNGLADMLTTSLGHAPRLTVIERVQIETAMRNFNLEMSGPIDSETAVRVGAWLGADAVVLGSFLKFGQVFRIDARMIDAETGEVLVAASESGREDAVMSMVDDLGGKLVARFDERVPAQAAGTGQLEVVFRFTKSEMGERPAYFHLCKLYVDGRYLDTSPLVRETSRWVTLFSRSLRSGRHRVQVVHGFAEGSTWDGRMPLQPDAFEVEIEAGTTSTVRYAFEVGWFQDRFLYEDTWERVEGEGRS